MSLRVTNGTAVEASSTTLFRALEIAGRVNAKFDGGSMRPLMRSGCVASIVPCRTNELRIGDVAVYVSGDRIVAHVVRRRASKGPIPSSLGAVGEETEIEDAMLLGRVEGVVLGRHTFSGTPRFLACRIVVATDRLLRFWNRINRNWRLEA